jgi:hypothetical protein
MIRERRSQMVSRILFRGAANSALGENRGSSPLGSANKIKDLFQKRQLVSNNCPINVYGQAWTSIKENVRIRAYRRMSARAHLVCWECQI